MSWATISQAAEFFHCSSRTIRRKIKIGKLSTKLSNGMRMVWLAEQVHTVSSHKASIPKERYVIPLFELYEGLSIVRMRFESPLEMADFLEYAAPPSSQGKASEFHKNCRFFFENLDKSFRQVDRLLNTFDLDRTVLLTLYRTFVILKTHWQESGLYLHEEPLEEKVKGQSDTLAIFHHLLEQARMLLLLCAQQSSSETESHMVMVKKGILEMAPSPRIEIQEDLASQLHVDGTVSIDSSQNKKHSILKNGNRDAT
jgi:hypothetical protein